MQTNTLPSGAVTFCAAMVSSLSNVGFVTIAERQDYRVCYLAARHVLAVGEARGYELQTSVARHLLVGAGDHWHQPLEDSVARAHRVAVHIHAQDVPGVEVDGAGHRQDQSRRRVAPRADQVGIEMHHAGHRKRDL